MKDFPIFPTEHGVASLTLREIPYRKTAYIHVQDVQPGKMAELLEECTGFCRACGAEEVLAGGAGAFDAWPFCTGVMEMNLCRTEAEDPTACLWPVTEENVGTFRAIYNEGMAGVDLAATLPRQREAEILESCGAYFVHRDGKLLGIGWISGEELKAIVSVIPGMGQTVLQTLLSASCSERIRLEVASTNMRAIRLYERMGFLKTRELMRWHRVWPSDSTNK